MTIKISIFKVILPLLIVSCLLSTGGAERDATADADDDDSLVDRGDAGNDQRWSDPPT